MKQEKTGGRYLQKEKGNTAAGKKRKRLWIRTAAVLGLLLLAGAVLYVCLRPDKLEGTWRYDEVTAYQFDGRGSGSLVLPDTEYPFSYRLTGGKLQIDFESEAARDAAYDYTVTGSELTLSRGEGEEGVTYVLRR